MDGNFAGITGLVGMGGVGKTFLAIKVAHYFDSRGWDVVWVSLLEQGVGEAADQIPERYGLQFVRGLRLSERLAAIRHLIASLREAGRNILVIMDNAEKFPNLGLLLDALEGGPLLVTSRVRECPKRVVYEQLKPMSQREALDLCHRVLEEARVGTYESLGPEEEVDLGALCDFLGGHPLGIRMVLSGFLRMPGYREARPGRFGEIQREIRDRGLSAIPRNRAGADAPGTLTLHETIESTFAWLFEDIEEFDSEFGSAARQVLPVVSALAVTPVASQAVVRAVSELVERVIEELVPEFDAGGWLRSMAGDRSFPYAQAVAVLLEVGFEKQMSNPDFLQSIDGVFDSLPPEVAEQAMGLWEALSAVHPGSSVERLRAALQGDSSLAAQVGWLDGLIQHPGDGGHERYVAGALATLERASLVERVPETKLVTVHPLIREYALAARASATPIRFGSGSTRTITMEGPGLSLVCRVAVSVIAADPTRGEGLLDLLPRLSGAADQLKASIRRIRSVGDQLYYDLGDWSTWRRLLEGTLATSLAAGLIRDSAWAAARLGELLDRMEDPQARPVLDQAVAALSDDPDPEARKQGAWPRAYRLKLLAHNNEATVRSLLELRRELEADEVVDEASASNLLLSTVRAFWDAAPTNEELVLTPMGSRLLSNTMLDLTHWLNTWRETLTPDELARARTIRAMIDARHAVAIESADAVTPVTVVWSDHALMLAGHWLGDGDADSLSRQYDEFGDRLRRIGVRGFGMQAARHRTVWRHSVLAGDGPTAIAAAKALMETWRASGVGDSFTVLLAEARWHATRLCFGESAPTADKLMPEYRDVGGCSWLDLATAVAKGDAALLKEAVARSEKANLVVSAATRRLHGLAAEQIGTTVRPTPGRDAAPVARPARVRDTRDGRLMRLVSGGLQRTADGRVQWLYPFYIDEEPLDLAGWRRSGQTRALAVIGDGPDLCGLSHAAAASWAQKVGKRLPTRGEWYAATRQLGHDLSPAQWPDAITAKRRYLDCVEAAVRDCAAPLVEHADGSLHADLRAACERHWSGRWIDENPRLAQAVQSELVEGLAPVAASLEDAQRLVRSLCVSISIDQKSKIVELLRRSPETVWPQMVALQEILNEERVKFAAMDAVHLHTVVRLGASYQRQLHLQLLGAAPLPPQIESRHPCTPLDDSVFIESWWEMERAYLSGEWLKSEPTLWAAVNRRLIEPLGAENTVGDVPLGMAVALAHEVGVQDKLKLGDLGHPATAESIIESIADQRQMSRTEPIGAQIESARALVAALAPDVDLGVATFARSYHSGVRPSDPDAGSPALIGDPFSDDGWERDGLLHDDQSAGARTGIRGVIPIFDDSDLEHLDPVDESA